jgi:hypothetical protein
MTRVAATPPRARSKTVLGLGQLGRSLAATGGALASRLRTAGSRTRTALAPIGRTITSAGYLVAGAVVVAAVAGILLGWAELDYIAATLLAALVIAAVFAVGRSTYSVTIELEPRRVVAGERAFGRMLVTNSGRRTLLPTRMELPVGEGVAAFTVPRLAPTDSNEELFAVPTSRRALILAGPALSVRGDPLGLIRRTVAWTDQIELFVHPQTARLRARAHGLVRDLEGSPTNVITNSDLAFHALRPYEAGDDMRNVHWRTTARTGQIMVRQYQETRRSQLLLVQRAEAADYASDEEFELAVSIMASVACQVILEDSTINVAWDRGMLRSRTPMALLDDSCRLETVTGTSESLRDLVRRSSTRLGVPSLVLLVVGSQLDVGQVRSVSTLYGNDTEVIALRASVGAVAGLSRVGAVTVATVSALRELAPLLDRAAR